MDFFTEAQKALLMLNGRHENYDKDNPPVVMLKLPGTGCVWLLSEINPEDDDIAFGLCDLGMGFPELGNVSISELQSLLYFGDQSVVPENSFTAEFPMSIYTEAAKAEGGITTDQFALLHAHRALKRSASFPSAPKPL